MGAVIISSFVSLIALSGLIYFTVRDRRRSHRAD